MLVKLGNNAPSYATMKRLVTRFRTGHSNTEDKERLPRPMEATSWNNVDIVCEMVVENKRVAAKVYSRDLELITRIRGPHPNLCTGHQKDCRQVVSQIL